MIDLHNLTIEQARKDLDNAVYTSVALVQACLDVNDVKNQEINAYLEVFSEEALSAAAEADKMIASGQQQALTGIPIAIKDNILIKGHYATAASKILENHVATYDAHVIERLRDQGAILIGRTNMDEFAMGSSTEHSAYGITKNPYDSTKVPGGSSGGSAAAVAMDGALGSLGSDTGGSIRQPASFCGVVGLYPTYGTVSRRGVMSMGSSLDQIGPIGKTVKDTQVIHQVIAGYDAMDSTSLKSEDRGGVNGADGKTLGVPTSFVFQDGVSDEVKENFKASIELLKAKGYIIKEIDLELLKKSLAMYYVIMPAEVSSNLARYDGVRYGKRAKADTLSEMYSSSRGEGFGKETQRRIMLGTYVLSSGYYDAYYGKALAARDGLREDLANVFEGVDCIVTPTTPTTAFGIGEIQDPLAMYMTDIFTVPANMAGVPALSVPSGKSTDGLPFGVQFMGSWHSEEMLFKIGADFEDAQASD